MENDYVKQSVTKRRNIERLLYFYFKRVSDFILSAGAIVVLLPLLLFLSSFYLYGENKGQILFKQKRVGQNGRMFYIYKFRSMVSNAEEMLKKDNDLYEKYCANNYKLDPEEDPRITKFGKFIRKTSLDELPQFFNVLKGEMSLVGPRPVVKEELLEYKDRTDKFLSVKPGITGYWQANGRSNVGYPDRVNIELYYVDHQSVKLDLKIIIQTFAKVILRKGAY
ncbi:sugar transferase [Alkalibacterium pelagium]|uniref:Sugar transferase involved in LPS biosynthesis (Colanic, teichoic acid) n=1 Tax=Alkalibacterium pelagium TaxID=426702 RepID=A0A1H7HQ26_9LACT|nr:sugar transferase [Alkalibacterium pelagium]GEN50383.1 exopolysaccharide biosynthesis protein [Alkalibacterium pelagium]SEK52288.1 Sugar transferase involved in LPS biosynthesis (colanic, teichoic acid) [Alkalibacterium pelagium]